MTQIIELNDQAIRDHMREAVKTIFPAFVQAKFGNSAKVVFKHLHDGKVEGTVLSRGEYFDVYFSEGAYKAIPA